MASSALVSTLEESTLLSTQVLVRAWIHLGYSTDKTNSHQFGAVFREHVSVSKFKEITSIIFHTQNGVQPRFCSPDSTSPGTCGHRGRTYQTKLGNEVTTPTGGEPIQGQSRRRRE